MKRPRQGMAIAAGSILAAMLCLGAAFAMDAHGFDPREILAGGGATSIDPPDRNAYAHPSANMSQDDEMRFHLGRALFRKLWVASPSSTQASDGLGPLFNARSCETCHVRDGRGRPPEAGRDASSFLIRLARPPGGREEEEVLASGAVLGFPDPVYGAQLQDRAINGLSAEGRPEVSYMEERVTLADGTDVALRHPRYMVKDLAYGPLDPQTTLSPRIAQPMIGLGLIEAIDEKDLLALEDAGDRNGDGVSGRAAHVRDLSTGRPALGRFGWKAQAASVRDQTAIALVTDIGISSPLLPSPGGDCTAAETECLSRPHGIQPRLGPQEVSDTVLDLLTFYTQNLAVPARRKASFQDTLKGKAQFHLMGCAACHVPSFTTRADAAISALGGQRIWPYSDFLLHDMGDGLADGQRVGDASGREWRTPPLWGIGLAETVNGNGFFLHDGRARELTEAILWHGGEAAGARNAFAAASARDRQSLITFLESL
jgi:CxxC motif-containing protein (DUF1111 family)